MTPPRSFQRSVAIFIYLLSAIACAPAVSLAQDAAVAERVVQSRSPIAESRDLIQALMSDQLVPGFAVAVWQDDRIVWSAGLGFSDVETSVPVWPHTRFRIGSISKPLTAFAVGQLMEQGKLDLDRPVREYVPYWPLKEHVITPRQLAGHLAGIRHYEKDEFLMARSFPNVESAIAIFADDPLLHPPGDKHLYSSYGFNLLSAVIEGAADEEFLSYMQREVFNRLGMNDTVADRPEEIIRNRTRFYAREAGRIVNAPHVNNSYKWAGGGFLSTPEDLIRFAVAHLDAEVLDRSTIELLWEPQSTSNGESTNYGIGWRTEIDDHGRRRVGHGGGSVGGSSQLVMYPAERLVVAMTANLSNVRFDGLQYEIAELFLNGGEQ